MKVIIAISDSFCSNFIKGQGQYLYEQGHEVIIVSGPGEEIDRLEETEEVKVVRIPFAREISPLRDLKCLFKVIRLIREEKPDVINAGNPKTGFLFSLAHTMFFHIPLIFTLRGIRSDTLSGFKRGIVRLTEKITCLFSNKVIAISPSLKDHALQLGLVSDSKCVVLSKGSSNGLNLNYFISTEEIKVRSRELLEFYSIDNNSFKLLFVGRLTKDKGVAELLDAFEHCVNNGASIELILAGPMEMEDPLESKYYELINSHEKIHYLGKQIDVRPVYASGDALVLYSYREGFGNVAIEASAFGLPTIVANIPGLKDTTENGKTGIHVEPKNFLKLAESIMYLYNNRVEAVRMGQKGQERIFKYFSNEVVWSKQLELYLSLCK